MYNTRFAMRRPTVSAAEERIHIVMKEDQTPLISPSCREYSPNVRLTFVVLSIGAASHFLLYLDSVVDNLLPAAMPFLRANYDNEREAELGWEMLVASRMYGLACGCLASIVLSDNSGRKHSVLLGTVLDVIGIIFTLGTVYLPMGVAACIVGRFINGLGQGIVQTAGAVMIAEIPPLRRRGTALATLTVWACLGELLGMAISLEDVMGRESIWSLAMAVPLVLLIPALFVLWYAPESPRYLYMTSRELECRKSLSFYQSANDARISLEDIELETRLLSVDINANTKRKGTGWEAHLERFKDRRFVQPLLLAAFVQGFVHLDDWIWISYSTKIFETSGLTSNLAQKASLLMAIPQALVSFVLLKNFDDFPRRALLLMPTVMSVAFGIFCIAYSKLKIQILPIQMVLPIVAAADLAAASVSGEAAYGVVPELFMPADRVLGTALVGFAQNVFGGILTTFVLTAVSIAGISTVLIPFVIANLIYAVVCYLYLPETSGRSATEVADSFSSSDDKVNLLNGFNKLFIWLATISPFNGKISKTKFCFIILQFGIFSLLLHFFW